METKKTIRDLLDAASLSGGDYLPVNQPNVYNLTTLENGDTRKITVEELGAFITAEEARERASADQALQDTLQSNINEVETRTRIVGKKVELLFQPSALQLAKWRLLVLNYQIIEIALYQDLCDLMWCGSAANATAEFWYKCNANGTRNASGLYMRVLDGRGMFWRGAGANAVFKGANNTPYDGNSIGSFIGDAVRNIHGAVNSHYTQYAWSNGAFSYENVAAYYPVHQGVSYANESSLIFDLTNIVPTALENRPASISYLPCISY